MKKEKNESNELVLLLATMKSNLLKIISRFWGPNLRPKKCIQLSQSVHGMPVIYRNKSSSSSSSLSDDDDDETLDQLISVLKTQKKWW